MGKHDVLRLELSLLRDAEAFLLLLLAKLSGWDTE